MTGNEAKVFDVTVVLRSYNDADLLPRTLAALDGQSGVRVTLIVFESASTDQSPAILEEHGYHRIEHLAPGTYHSSRVLNQGVEWAETEFVAFVNSDAVLLSDDVLLKLATVLDQHSDTAGVFARQVVRPDASLITRLDHDTAFEHREELGEAADHLSLVTSMIRRSCWEDIPFNTTLTYAEDYVWSANVKAKGWKLAYVKEAVVEHSHNYSADEMYRRSFGDAAAMAVLSEKPPPRGWIRGALLPCLKRVLKDVKRLYHLGEINALWQLPRYRWASSLGDWHGRKAAWQSVQANPLAKQATAPKRGDEGGSA